MDLLTELRVPTRSAPRPPDITSSTSAAAAAAAAAAITSPPRNNDMWSGIDPFSPIMTTNQKKKPPPRPPPPKFTIRSNNTPQDKPKNKPTRPTELITNLFGRRGSKSSSSSVSSNATVQNYGTTIRNSFPTKQQQQHQSQSLLFNDTQSSSSNGPISMCLIDLSPPGSPTPSSTTRSSSDGVSVDSFGSDGNSNPSAFTSGSSACSAFEDDFDFFGNLSVNGKKPNNHLTATASAASNDPWKVSCTQDPFGSFDAFASSSSFLAATQYQQQQQPQQQQWSTTSSTASSILQQQTQIKEIGESNFFAFNDINTTTSTSLFDAAPTAATPSPLPTSSSSTSPTEGTAKANFVMPTIIRAKKPSNNKEPPPKPALPPALSMSKYSSAPRLTPVSDDNKPGWAEDASPPMPKLPPPPPPPEYMASLEDGLVENFERPYGVALYNFPATQPGDLELKEGDVVYLTKAVNDDWMEGCVGVTEGIFPANFIDVKVPLPGRDSNVVKALYDFNAETFDDLSFKEGATIKVLSRISDEWLYGECNGDKGQFPANFVDRVPSDLAAHL